MRSACWPDAAAPCASPLMNWNSKTALLKLENALLQLRRRRGARPSPTEEQAVQTFGRSLFDMLLTGDPAQPLLPEHAPPRDRGAQACACACTSARPNWPRLPWEYLYDPRRARISLPVAWHAHSCAISTCPTPSSRCPSPPPLQHSSDDRQPQRAQRTAHARCRAKSAALESALAPLKKRGLVELVWLEGQTWRDLQRSCAAVPGTSSTSSATAASTDRPTRAPLALADDDGQLYLINATHLGRVLANHGSLRLVVLNACDGAKAASATSSPALAPRSASAASPPSSPCNRNH